MKKIILLLTLLISTNIVIAMPNSKFEDKANSQFDEFPLFMKNDTVFIMSNRPKLQISYVEKINENIFSNFSIYSFVSATDSTPTIAKIKGVAKGSYPAFSKTDAPFLQAFASDYHKYNTYNKQNLYSSQYNNKKYLLSINSFFNWSGQPAISPAGDVLFFSSDNFGGGGGMDLWYALKDSNGFWSQAKPLEALNTIANEITPHIGNDGYFYYASNGTLDDTTEYNIYRSSYRIEKKRLIPMIGTRVKECQSSRNEFSPVIDIINNKLYFASDKKYPIGGLNVYSVPLDTTNPKLVVQTIKNISSLWLKDITSGDYYDIKPSGTFYLKQNHTYKIQVPQNIINNRFAKFPKSDTFTAKTKDTTIKFFFNFLHKTKEYGSSFMLCNTKEQRFFIDGWWHPLSSENHSIYKQKEIDEEFIQTSFVDSSGFNYSTTVHKNDSIFNLSINHLLSYLKNFDYSAPFKDTMYIDLKVYSRDYKIKKHKTPYREWAYKKHFYTGDTVVIPQFNNNDTLIIPKGLNILEDEWEIGNKEYEISDEQKGRRLLTKIRAYNTYKMIDEKLALASSLYNYLKIQNRLIFHYDGYGIDEENEDSLYADRIELTYSNKNIIYNEDRKYSRKEILDNCINCKEEVSATKNETLQVVDMISTNTIVPQISKDKTPKQIQTIAKEKRHKELDKKITTELEDSKTKTSKTVYFYEIAGFIEFANAMATKELLGQKGVQDLYVVKYYDFYGSATYILRGSLNEKQEETRKAIKEYRWIPEYLKMKSNLILKHEKIKNF